MLSLIAVIFPTLASWINGIIGFFQGQAQAQTDQSTAVSNAEAQHMNDGAQSVIDATSSQAQNVTLDQAAAQLDSPTPIVVTTPTPIQTPTKGS